MSGIVLWLGAKRLHVPQSGAPKDCFLKNICSDKQKLPRVFYSWRKAKNFEMTVHVPVHFRSLSNKFPTIF